MQTFLKFAAAAAAAAIAFAAPELAFAKPRNVVIFVADGLRYGIVTPETAPTLSHIQKEGVDFRNSHALYPSVTTSNASVIATGHGIGDTGEWSNTLFTGKFFVANKGALTAGAENNLVLEEMNSAYGGNYFNEVSLLAQLRANGYQTAAVGKEGPTLIQDIQASDGRSTIVVDDSTGGTDGRAVPLPKSISTAILAAGLSLDPSKHRANGNMYGNSREGLKVSNAVQQDWFGDVATKVLLPKFVKADKPFAMVYWSRDPDGTQHNTGDSINSPYPGINGPTSLAGVRNASDNLQKLIDSLKRLGVYENTDIFVTADHGFSTISRVSKTSWASTQTYPDTLFPGEVPEGFVAIDVAHALELPLSGNFETIDATKGEHPKGTAYLGADRGNADAIFLGSGNSQLIYLNRSKAAEIVPRIVEVLTQQDYVGAIFVSDELGSIPGTLPMSVIGLKGSALTPAPAIYISFAESLDTQCLAQWKSPELCSVQVSDTSLQQGQGNHGGFVRANTRNFMAAIGPDFKKGYTSLLPISNADIAPTLAHLLGVTMPSKGKLAGRIIKEAIGRSPEPKARSVCLASSQAVNGFSTVLNAQRLGDRLYLDAAGMPGRVVGLSECARPIDSSLITTDSKVQEPVSH